MTTLQPRPAYSAEELKALYPEGLELQLVQVLLRHGERSPVSARFQNAGLNAFVNMPLPSCFLCYLLMQFAEAMLMLYHLVALLLSSETNGQRDPRRHRMDTPHMA